MPADCTLTWLTTRLWVIGAVKGHIHPEVADLFFPNFGLERVYRTVPMLFGAERTEEMDE